MIKIRRIPVNMPVIISLNGEDLFMLKDDRWSFKTGGLWYSEQQESIKKLLNHLIYEDDVKK